MIQVALKITSGIVSIYFLLLTVYAGAACILFVSPYIKSGGFKKEAAVAKYGGWAYIFGGIGLYIIVRLLV
ncbi:MAG: hypothetical protein PWR27_2004 [Petroclostridium sp.]|jgi:hypothetical protein|uniref:CLC_0170 family protein n=1 Tax=Petroclostridium xylanilyticum TaxID=1792311 RepID=UPI000B9882A4|nr:CLC_0170 family protein [Petroclostridium xylanilyticum]MBZ4645427.1 hypothetical protein [Clostridia bacterium]MDK2811295.1 hypothetical protein [Petroclostridium sp.]